MGGLGNILFQLAYGKYLEQQSWNVEFVDSLLYRSWVTNLLGWTIHPVTLPKFKKELNIVTDKRISPILNAKLPVNHGYSSYYEKYKIPLSQNLFGYFQTHEHANKLDIIKPANLCSNKIGLHIRLKDSPYISDIKGYLNEVIQLVSSEKDYIIYSDDLDLARSILPNNLQSVAFSTNSLILDDFYSLMDHETLIISDSTFSWWAGVLSDCAKRIIMPKRLSNQIGMTKNFNLVYETSRYCMYDKI